MKTNYKITLLTVSTVLMIGCAFCKMGKAPGGLGSKLV